jgi:hypothetical protein
LTLRSIAVRSTPQVPKCRVAGGADGDCSKARRRARGGGCGATMTALVVNAATLIANESDVCFTRIMITEACGLKA